ncbi:MAG: tRNA threonylcarbamoyladenosine dehydratase [Oscillospiraceae bacterium]|nr:tRNA threonylcarbamoyladenosine dehydratase [Oscillospiraceae bacterium]
MEDRLTRTRMLLGGEAVEKLQGSHVAVFGLGGVGSWCAEALVRSGVEELTLVDDDFVEVSNMNRQAEAVEYTLGEPKAIAMSSRLKDIAPMGNYHTKVFRFCEETREDFFNEETKYDYVVDAIDIVTCKLDLIETCVTSGVPIISSLGAGNKLDASLLCIADLSETNGCPFARVVRKELRARGIEHLKVVYSPEPAAEPQEEPETLPPGRNSVPASSSWVPPVAGFLMAQAVILDLTGR